MPRPTSGKISQHYESEDGTAHVQYIVHYRIDRGEPMTHEYPGSPPELEITDVQIVLLNLGTEQSALGLVHDLLTELVTNDGSLFQQVHNECIEHAAEREAAAQERE